MSNLIDKYGRDWFAQKFAGSYFRYQGVPARVSKAIIGPSGTNVVSTTLCPRVNGKVVKATRLIPASHFKDSSMFSVPELGYRHTNSGKWLAFIRRNNGSYIRGLSTRNLNVYESELTKFLRVSGMKIPHLTEDEITNLIMEPTFIPLQRGIKLMLEGKLLSFAASSTVAVVPSTDSPNLTVLMCDKRIGEVTPDGVMNISLSIAKSYVEETLCESQ